MSDPQQIFSEAVQLHKTGKLPDAERLYRDIIAAVPGHWDALHLLGVLEMQSGRYRDAVTHIGRAITAAGAKPVAEFHTNIAAGYRALGKLDEAARHLEAVVTLKPADAMAHFRAGLILMEKGDAAAAVPYFRNALAIKADYVEAQANLGMALRLSGQLPEAVKALHAAVGLQPNDASTHYSLGMAQKDMRDIKGALASFATAVSVDPRYAAAQWNLALAHLLLGDFAEGWKTFDWYTRIKGASTRTFAQPAWDGGNLAGKTILLYEEHGYGDTLQFIRYARDLKKHKGAGRVVVLCRPEMERLFASAPDVDIVGSGETPPPFDCHVSFFALPKMMRTEVATIPGDVPYLFAPSDLVMAWKGRDVLKSGRNAGIVWRGNKNTDARRAMAATHVAKVCAVSGFNWISLQVGVDEEEARVLTAAGVKDCGAQFADWADTAALISTLDLVVTVDTAVAHLAGAMGKPVWILLPFVPDWRWLLERADSPWYPTARLFRQQSAAGLDDAVDDLCRSLAAL